MGHPFYRVMQHNIVEMDAGANAFLSTSKIVGQSLSLARLPLRNGPYRQPSLGLTEVTTDHN